MNRGLYMNERTYRKSSGFEPLAKDISRFMTLLLRSAPFADERPLAAE